MKTTISQRDFYVLMGLEKFTSDLVAQLDLTAKAVADVVGEGLDEYGYGHSSDFVYGEENARGLLARLGISVEPEPAKVSAEVLLDTLSGDKEKELTNECHD